MRKLLSAFPRPFLVFLAACFVIVEGAPLRIDFVTGPDDLRRAEFYPFSSFPMYADFSDTPNYVYVTTPDGKKLACVPDLAVLSSVLKKAYSKELRKLKEQTGISMGEMTAAQKRPAGDATLRLLREQISAQKFEDGSLPHLQLHEVIITRGQDGIESEDLIVGDVRF